MGVDKTWLASTLILDVCVKYKTRTRNVKEENKHGRNTGVRREEGKERGRNVRRSGSASCLHARAGVSLKQREIVVRETSKESTKTTKKKKKKKKKGFYEQRRREDSKLPGTHTSETNSRGL